MGRITAEILAEAAAHERHIEYFKRKAPYFPDYHHEYDSVLQIHYITTLVRHEHEGTWYVRHHYSTTITEDADQAMKEFLQNVYLDMKFGKIHPDFERPNGEPLDDEDELQVPEAERMGIRNAE